jgi:hypothetical protein
MTRKKYMQAYLKKYRETHKEERKKAARDYYDQNRERVLLKSREYARTHREQERERAARWRRRHPDRVREISRRYSRKPEVQQRRKQYRKEHLEQDRAHQRKYQLTDRGRWSTYRASAKRRGLVWQLTFAEFQVLIHSPCAYHGTPESNGIDRLSPDKGYTVENSVACCAQCNYMKLDMTATEFLSHVAAIMRHTRSIRTRP